LKGSQPTDGGNLLFTPNEAAEFIKNEPKAEKFIKPFIGADEFINGKKRYCLWLKDASPAELRQMPRVLERLDAVKAMRLASTKEATRKYAEKPWLFTEIRQPDVTYIGIPRHSSENRDYIPMQFFTPDNILGDSCLMVPGGSIMQFGVLNSAMHMAWVRAVCGRIKSDYRYSNQICYNPFPWPMPKPDQKKKIEAATQAVLDARAAHPGSTLADLYDPRVMPADLRKAHQALDKAVDAAYRSQPFTTEAARLEHLLGLYQQLVTPLIVQTARKPKKAKN